MWFDRKAYKSDNINFSGCQYNAYGKTKSARTYWTADANTKDIFRPHTSEGLIMGLSRFAPSFTSRMALAAADYAGYRLYDYLTADKVDKPFADQPNFNHK